MVSVTSYFIFPLRRLSFLLSLVVAFLFSFPFFANGEDFLPAEKAYVFSYDQNGSNFITLKWDIAERYYLYKAKFIFQADNGIEIVHQEFLTPSTTISDEFFGTSLVHEGLTLVSLNLSAINEPQDGTLSVNYQGCWKGGVCHAPANKVIFLKNISTAPANLTRVGQEDGSLPSRKDESLFSQNLLNSSLYSERLAQGDIYFIILTFFIAGLLLSFAPCHLPLFPILSSIVIGKEKGRFTSFFLSLVYVLSMAATYAGAGVLAGLFGANLQATLQEPWIIILFSLLLALLGFSLFGLFPLSISRFTSKFGGARFITKKNGWIRAVLMGVSSALLVGPCMVAPLAGSLIFIGSSGDPLMGGMALFILSIGMGVPLILFGVSAGKLMPQTGAWMVQVNYFFGVLLILLSIWLLGKIIPGSMVLILCGGILVIYSFVFWSFFMRLNNPRALHKAFQGGCLLIFIYGIALFLGGLAGGNDFERPLSNFSERPRNQSSAQNLKFDSYVSLKAIKIALLDAKKLGKPVIIDFYADWCISCKKIEAKVFTDPSIVELYQYFSLLKADVTIHDAQATELYREYQVLGPPTYLFVDGKGELRKQLTLVGEAGPKEFIRIAQLLLSEIRG